MIRYDLLLYDCDGTIYDTYPGIKANLINTLGRLKLPPMPADFNWRSCVGPPLEFIFEILLDVDHSRVTEACSDFRAHYNETVIPLSVLFPGLETSVRKLKSNGVMLGVASSKAQITLAETMKKDGLDDWFSLVLGPAPGEHVDKATIIERSIEKLNVPRSRILMIGDTFYDAEGACKAGVDFCAVTWGYAEPSDFDKFPYVFKADCPEEIADFVLGK